MCVHIKRSVCPSARRTFIEGASHGIQFAKQWLHSPDLLVTFALNPSPASVYQDVSYVYIPYKFSSARQKEEKITNRESIRHAFWKIGSKHFHLSGCFSLNFPIPGDDVVCMEQTESVRTLTTKASSMVWKQKFPIDNISACYFSLSLGCSSLSLSRSCCLLAS